LGGGRKRRYLIDMVEVVTCFVAGRLDVSAAGYGKRERIRVCGGSGVKDVVVRRRRRRVGLIGMCGAEAAPVDTKTGEFAKTTEKVEKLYDTYPFPPDPLIDEAPIGYNWRWHYPSSYAFCTGRAPEDSDAPLRILDAGCGTGCGTEYLVHLNPNAHVTALDLSSSALDVARERIGRSCGEEGLKRVTFEHRSLFDVHELPGQFDQINCVGVIHHTPDPLRALRALADKLAPGGICHIFVYALYGRWEIMLMQRALKLMQHVDKSTGDFTRGVELARRVFKALPDGNRLKEREKSRWAQENQRDSTFADMYLHPQEFDYTVRSVFELIDASGLDFVAFSNPRNFDLTRLLKSDPELLELAEALPLREKLELVELLDPESVTHFEFFLTKPPLRVTDWSDDATLRAATATISPCIHGFPGNMIFDRDYYPLALSSTQRAFLEAVHGADGAPFSVDAALKSSEASPDCVRSLVRDSVVVLQEAK